MSNRECIVSAYCEPPPIRKEQKVYILCLVRNSWKQIKRKINEICAPFF